MGNLTNRNLLILPETISLNKTSFSTSQNPPGNFTGHIVSTEKTRHMFVCLIKRKQKNSLDSVSYFPECLFLCKNQQSKFTSRDIRGAATTNCLRRSSKNRTFSDKDFFLSVNILNFVFLRNINSKQILLTCNSNKIPRLQQVRIDQLRIIIFI